MIHICPSCEKLLTTVCAIGHSHTFAVPVDAPMDCAGVDLRCCALLKPLPGDAGPVVCGARVDTAKVVYSTCCFGESGIDTRTPSCHPS
jgi:hypothetical protein